jgi:hypothetical protein
VNLLQGQIAEIKKHCGLNTLDLVLSSDFSSSQSNYRQFIRQDVIQKYANKLSNAEIEDIQNLKIVPTAKNIFFSISHNERQGGYTASAVRHGFDIEIKSRMTAPIIQRVSSAEEVASAPDLRFLWSAKEAVFKALGDSSKVISELTIGHWVSQNNTGLWSYQLLSGSSVELDRNTGYIFDDPEQIISIFFL